ncbi:MAG: regulator SirB [Alphaproteobacteria bacterium]|nr:MAG: regulator SirB [Alphaproteobacteria bacterium]
MSYFVRHTSSQPSQVGGLFASRGLALNVLGWKWVMTAPWRYGSYAIDTVLLMAAISLAALTGQYPFVDAWLTAKILLLVVYIILGSYALKRGRTRKIRIACWCAAMLVLLFIIGVARKRDPLGWFAG